MLPRYILAGVILIIALDLGRTSVSAGGATPSFLYTVAKTYEPLAWIEGGERFPEGAAIFVHDAKGQHPLFGDFAASADASVSFDGQRVLFAAKRKAEDRWQVWEVPLAGGAPRVVTPAHQDSIRPLYLPDDRVVYARGLDHRFVIEAADLAGGKAVALTYGPANYLPTDVLRDGRILFEAGYPLGSDTTPEIYTVYPDGSGVESYRCDHREKHHLGRQVSSGDIVFASRSGLSRFTSARALEVRIPVPVGEYAGDAAELPSGEWLMPWRRDATMPFQLVTLAPDSTSVHPAVVENGANILQPVMVAERVAPKRFPSGLHDWPNANLLCLNAYTSKYQFAEGSIQSVRFYGRDSAGQPTLLGSAPVEGDGSFFVQVPSEQPLQVELLDGSGKTLNREAGYFWMRRGEQRVCVGCHAGPETAPENAVPMTLLKSTVPADMTGAHRAAGGQ